MVRLSEWLISSVIIASCLFPAGIYANEPPSIANPYFSDQPIPATKEIIEEQHAKYSERMKKDSIRFKLHTYDIEKLYQRSYDNISRHEKDLEYLIKEYPDANLTGCAWLYYCMNAQGKQRETHLKKAISYYNDCWYSNGVQVGVYARYQLACIYWRTGRFLDADALFDEIRKDYPHAITSYKSLMTSYLPHPGQQSKYWRLNMQHVGPTKAIELLEEEWAIKLQELEPYLMGLEGSRGIANPQYKRLLQMFLDKLKKGELDVHLGYSDHPSESQILIYTLVKLGEYKNFNKMDYYAPVVRDDKIAALLVMALRSQCCAVGEAAADSVKYLSQQDLLRYRDEIVPQLIAMKKFNVMIYLPFSPEIGKLMTDKAKNYMNQRDDIFLKRFRMGDPKGKSELIAKLNSDLRGDRIESKFAASPLGIIGDRESIIALLQRLPTASPETKFQIIKAIWRNFPDDECWLKCAPEIMTGKSRELTDDFYLDVSDWAEKNFLIKLDFSQTSPDVGEYYHPESHQRLKPSTGEKP